MASQTVTEFFAMTAQSQTLFVCTVNKVFLSFSKVVQFSPHEVSLSKSVQEAAG